MQTGSWIYEENLKPFLHMISDFIDYDLEIDEIIAIEEGIKTTETEKDIWYNYPFKAKEEIKLKIGRDEPGTGIIFFVTESTKETSLKIEAIGDLLNQYIIKEKMERP